MSQKQALRHITDDDTFIPADIGKVELFAGHHSAGTLTSFCTEPEPTNHEDQHQCHQYATNHGRSSTNKPAGSFEPTHLHGNSRAHDTLARPAGASSAAARFSLMTRLTPFVLRVVTLRVTRSRIMAMITIARPPTKPVPTSSWLNPATTTAPRPPPPMSAAMTTIESASMITWLTPAMIVGSASGSSTLIKVCPGVAPKAWAASTVSRGTCWMPSMVSRMAGGMAKI